MKKIGIVGWKTGENSFGTTVPYIEYFKQFGEVVILSPSLEVMDLDLLVLPGGQDTLPVSYGEAPSLYNTNPDMCKEFFFKHNLSLYIEKGTPIFGICLGMQMINIHFGGKLTQNLPFHPYSSKNRSELVHELVILNPEYSRLIKNKAYSWYMTNNKYEVNSLHHQGIEDETQLGVGLEIVACETGKDAGEVIEAIKHCQLPIAGVQYHPEEIYDPLSALMINDLLNYKEVNKQEHAITVSEQ